MAYNKNVGQFDDLLGVFANAHSDIDSLFDTFFHWLRFRTDFFHIRETSEETKGFYKGEAQKILLRIFNKHLEEYRVDMLKNNTQRNPKSKPKIHDNENTKLSQAHSTSNPSDEALENKSVNETEQISTETPKSAVVWISWVPKTFRNNNEEVQTMIKHILGDSVKCMDIMWPDEEGDSSIAIELDNFGIAKDFTKEIKDGKYKGKHFWNVEDNDDPPPEEIEAELITYTSSDSKESSNSKIEQTVNQDPPMQLIQQPKPDRHIEPWNGGTTEDYVWSQSIDEISVEYFNMKPPLNKNDIEINVGPKHLKIFHKGKAIKSGELFGEILWGDLIWSIENSSTILITIFKKEELWWSSLFIGDDKIDTTKIEAVKNLSDYDDATQAEVRKMILQHNSKKNYLNPDSIYHNKQAE